MAVLLANNATSRLASSLTAGATTLSVTPGEGAKFPSPTNGNWFPLVLIKAGGAPEILKCTARAGDIFTVQRAQEGTAAQAFSAGDRVELRATAAVFIEGQQKTAEAKQAADDAQQAADDAQQSADLGVKKDADTSTGAALLPGGTQAQRPASPSNGMFRYNSEKHQFEGYQNGKWGQIGGGDAVLSIKPKASRALIGDGEAAADGQLLSRTTYPDAWAQAQSAGLVISDAEWLADPLNRGFYSSGDGSTTFRLPDYNGKQAGSLGAVFLRGDGALSAGQAGLIQKDQLGPMRYANNSVNQATSVYVSNGVSGLGATLPRNGPGSIQADPVDAAPDGTRWITNTGNETRPLNLTVVWAIKLFGAVVNVGSADAAQLASDYANLAGAVGALSGRVGILEAGIRQLPELLWSGNAGNNGTPITLSRAPLVGELFFVHHADAYRVMSSPCVITTDMLVPGRYWYIAFSGGGATILIYNGGPQFTVYSLSSGYPLGAVFVSGAKNV